MAEGRVDDEMIEIGDPTEESSGHDPAPRVVIQYHERGGVPWMLIPPLLVISAVGAIVFYIKVAPPRTMVQAPALAREDEAPRTGGDELETPGPPARDSSATFNDLLPEKAADPDPPADPVLPPPSRVEVAVEPPSVPEPPPVAKPQGIGFDPRAFEADRKPEAPADPAIAPAVREARPEEPEKPREVDPVLLPPDPLEARARQQQRRVEASQRVDEERSRFHAELKAICRQFREDSGPEILELQKRYNTRLEPTAQKRAAYLLGQRGAFAGTDRGTRIELLRSLGYPEPVILSDLYDNYEKMSLRERDGPRSEAEAFYLSALMLLKFPPPRPASAPRPVSATKGGATARPNPSDAGKRAGPAR